MKNSPCTKVYNMPELIAKATKAAVLPNQNRIPSDRTTNCGTVTKTINSIPTASDVFLLALLFVICYLDPDKMPDKNKGHTTAPNATPTIFNR